MNYWNFFRAIFVFFSLVASFVIHAKNEVNLQLKWFHQFQFAGYYAAQKEGYYADEELIVNINEFIPGQEEAIQSVLNGNSEFAIADSSLVLTKLNKAPVVVLAAIFQKSPLALMTLSKDELVSPLDLKGKRVMSRRNIDDAVITAMFSELNITDKQYTHVPHTFKDDELLSGRIDAMSVYITDQPYYYEQRNIKVNLIQPSNYGIDFYGDLIFTSKQYLMDNTEQALAFRRASIKGWQYALNNPEELVNWMLANLDINKTKEQLLFEADKIKQMIKPNLIELGTLNKKRFLRIAEIYKHRSKTSIKGDLDEFLYHELLYSNTDYKKVAYISWIVLLFLLVIALSFLAINKRLSTLVKERTQELVKSQHALKLLVNSDELTGVGNRRKLNTFFEQEIAKAKRYQRPLSLILLDIDFFKKINDQYGHTCGDKILKELAILLKENVRNTDLLGRWGGEEFLIICTETQLDGAIVLAELLRKAVMAYQFSENISLTCSFGVSQWQEGEKGETLFSHCDSALYLAKEAGRNCVKSI